MNNIELFENIAEYAEGVFMNQWDLKGEFIDIQNLIGQTQTEHYIIIGLLAIVAIIGIANLISNHKTRKMLRQMMKEQKKEKEEKTTSSDD